MIDIYILTRIPESDFVLLERIYQGNLDKKEKVIEILAACISLRDFVLDVAKSLRESNFADKDKDSGNEKGNQQGKGGDGNFRGGSNFFPPPLLL